MAKLGDWYLRDFHAILKKEPVYLAGYKTNWALELFQSVLQEAGHKCEVVSNTSGLANYIRNALKAQGLVVVFQNHPEPKSFRGSGELESLSKQHRFLWEVVHNDQQAVVYLWLDGKRQDSIITANREGVLAKLTEKFSLLAVA